MDTYHSGSTYNEASTATQLLSRKKFLKKSHSATQLLNCTLAIQLPTYQPIKLFPTTQNTYNYYSLGTAIEHQLLSPSPRPR
jgi:hypothetical protein